MDIWQWFNQYERDLREAGQPYITDHLNKFIYSICDVKPETSEALLAETRALKKTANNPWLEVFIGHWEMRHRLGNKGEGEKALADVVALFERAHQEDTRECPQSICVTQDLSDCYANMDGPGWADERIAVCQETLSRITPEWSCFQCISDEEFFAIIDKGEPERALTYIRQQIQKVLATGEEDVTGLLENEAEALILLGRSEEALALLAPLTTQEELDDAITQIRNVRLMLKAEAYARMGKTEEATTFLVNWSQLQFRGVNRWVRIVEELCHHDASFNTWQCGVSLQHIIDHQCESQAWRALIDTSMTQVRLAIDRKALWTARRAIQKAKQYLPRLRQPLGADQQLAALDAQIAAGEQANTLPVPAEELYQWLETRANETQQRNPEEEVEWLTQAAAQRPDDEALIMLAASALDTCQAPDEAITLLQTWHRAHPDSDSAALFELLNLLLKHQHYSEISEIADELRVDKPHLAYWFMMQVALVNESWSELERLSLLMLETDEGKKKVSPRLLASRAALKQHASERAIPYLQQALAQLEAQGEETNNVLWDLITAASIQQEWDIVRKAGSQLGMTFSQEEGPIDEQWGAIRIRFSEDHEDLYYLAQRTGPATATIVEPAWPKHRQHLGDKLVFDVQLLNTPPEDEAEREYFIGLYDYVDILSPGDYATSWFVDGVYPGEEAFTQLEEAVKELGGKIWVTHPDDYQVIDSANDNITLPGVYFNLAMPTNLLPKEIDTLLQMQTAEWEYPLHWLGLAIQSGSNEERHRQIIERFGL